MHGTSGMFLFQGPAVECAVEECLQAATILGKKPPYLRGEVRSFQRRLYHNGGVNAAVHHSGQPGWTISLPRYFAFSTHSHEALPMNSWNKSTLGKSPAIYPASDTGNRSLHTSSSINKRWKDKRKKTAQRKCLRYFPFWRMGVYCMCVA